MKTLGVLGGLSWESTALYYRDLNRGVAQRLGGLHNAALLVHSFDFEPVAQLQREHRWEEAGHQLAQAALGLQRAGAQGLLIASNTMHHVFDAVQSSVQVPLLHIADATGDAALNGGYRCLGLLGTRFTMEQRFYAERLQQRHGLQTITPDAAHREAVHRIIYEELCRGIVTPGSRQALVDMTRDLAGRGCDAVILGCTELTLLVEPDTLPLPVLDTTALHVRAAVDWMLDDDT